MNLSEIVDQLRRCNFECKAGPLETNAAFIALEKLAENQGEIQVQVDSSGWFKRLWDEDEEHENTLR